MLDQYLAAGPALVALENDRAAALTEAQESFNELTKHNELQHERIIDLESTLEAERTRMRERELLLDQKVVELLDENAHLKTQLAPEFLQGAINFTRRLTRHK